MKETFFESFLRIKSRFFVNPKINTLIIDDDQQYSVEQLVGFLTGNKPINLSEETPDRDNQT